MKLLTLLTTVFAFGCTPLYRVEPLHNVEKQNEVAKNGKSTKQKANRKAQEWKALGVYRLPRTDLRVDAEVAMKEISYGEHYCFGKNLGVGKGKVGEGECSKTCLPLTEVTPLVRKLEVTPETVPDASQEYIYKVRNKRRAVKRTSEFTTTSTALISGPEVEKEDESAGIAFGAFEGTPRLLPRSHDPRPSCADIELSAVRAANEYHAKDRCLRKLSDTEGAMRMTWESWKRLPQCTRVATVFKSEFEGLSGERAVQELGPRVEGILDGFRRMLTSDTYTFQKWIRVESKADANGHPPSLRIDNPVGLCREADTREKRPGSTRTPLTVDVCNVEGNRPLVVMSLRPVVGAQQKVGEEVEETANPIPQDLRDGDGLRYRLPETLLLYVELRPTSDLEASAKVTHTSEFRSLQVKPVTFSQLGPIVHAPDSIRGAPASIRMSVSEETGMLTKVRVSLEPVLRKKETGGTVKTVQTLTYESAPEEGVAAAASKLEQDNRLLRAQRENDCLRGLSDDCADLKKDPENKKRDPENKK